MKIVINRADGGISVMTVVEGCDEDECLKKWKDVHIDEYISHQPVEDDVIPKDRTLRGAWVCDTLSPVISLEASKVQEIQDKAVREVI